jgi:hypothetical protein
MGGPPNRGNGLAAYWPNGGMRRIYEEGGIWPYYNIREDEWMRGEYSVAIHHIWMAFWKG